MKEVVANQDVEAREDRPGLNMSALVDISFLLLVYFLVTSTLQPKESDLGLSVGRGGHGTGIDLMKIVLNNDGSVDVNGEILAEESMGARMPELRQRLVSYRTAAELIDDEPVVLFEAGDDSKGQRFVDVLNLLADVGLDHVQLAGL